jgi:4-diphosphocytidyl-2-C-methyl-D-erythritol kinase
VQGLAFFPTLKRAAFLLIHPGFGISTAWAYQQLARFPAALNGKPGRAQKLIKLLQDSDLVEAGKEFYNSLEAPALHKYPLLALFQDFLSDNGAAATLMSGSGSTTFALTSNTSEAENLAEKFKAKFGATDWMAIVPAN